MVHLVMKCALREWRNGPPGDISKAEMDRAPGRVTLGYSAISDMEAMVLPCNYQLTPSCLQVGQMASAALSMRREHFTCK